MPQFGGHEKYGTLVVSVPLTAVKNVILAEAIGGRTHPDTVPSFLPIPAKPPSSSIPAQTPALNSVSPINLNVPSIPIPLALTLSPTTGCHLTDPRSFTFDTLDSGLRL